MQIYNTLTRQKEQFKPLRSPEVKLYQCGPTVYNHAHIWNLKTSVVEDIVARTLKYLWYRVVVTMNLTDIDDKTIRDSQKYWESLKDFTEKYTEVFLSDIDKLLCERPDNISAISTLIPEMIRMIQTLLNKWFAYIADDGSVYYSIQKFKNYGQLAHLDISGMKTSVRVNNDEYAKDQAADFALWKAWDASDGGNVWEAEFEIPALTLTLSQGERGQATEKIIIKGRPGWHIECSACAMKHFGTQIDIHMWGEDLIFPHHQNEIAQTEACTGKPFSKYWIHSAHLLVWGKKMSKSLGNFYTLRDVEEKYLGETGLTWVLYRALRLSFFAGKYREQIDFSFEKLEQNIKTIQNIDKELKKLSLYESEYEWVRNEFREYMQDIMTRYIAALEDDFSMSEALAVFYEFQKYITSEIVSAQLSDSEQRSALDMYQNFHQVFAIFDFEALEKLDEDIPEDIITLATQRQEAKDDKNYARADEIRDELAKLWYIVKDTKEGSVVERV